MLDLGRSAAPPRLAGPGGRTLRVAHLTTVDMSLVLLLGTELRVDVESGLAAYGISAPGRYAERLRPLGVTHVEVPSLSREWGVRRDLRAAMELMRSLRVIRPDVLHTHNPKTGVLGRVMGRLAGVPVVVNTCHGLWATPEDPLGRRLMVYAAEIMAAACSDAELYQNDTDRRTLRRFVDQRKVRSVGNGVDLARFRPDPAARTRVRRELGVAETDILVGGVGRLVREKGITEFAAAAHGLQDSATFVWAGPADGPDSETLRRTARAVRFLDEREDMVGLYNALDLFVLPSYREGFSRAAMEAAACGAPMVLSDIRGCREIGRHGHEAYFVPAKDAHALEHAIRRLVGDPLWRLRLGSAARDRALSEFDQRRVAAVSLSTYASIARRRGLDWTEGGDR